MLDTSFLKSLLSYDFYEKNKEKLSKQLFEEDIRDLYQVITSAHDKYEHDLSTDELMSLWSLHNPVATKAEKREIYHLIEDIKEAQPISLDIASDSIETLWRRYVGKYVAEIGLQVSEGNTEYWTKLLDFVDQHREGFLPDDIGEPTTLSLTEILEQEEKEGYLEFNLTPLARKIPGLSRRKFGIIFANSNTGKTAFVLTLALGPGGYVDQGHKVLVLGNEEAATDTVQRAYGTALGLTKEQLRENRERNTEIFNSKFKDKFIIHGTQDWDMSRIEAAINKYKPAAVFVDQLDKVHVAGKYNATHEKLGEIYRQAREVAKRQNCVFWGVSQASNEATGRTRVTFDMMAGSKVSKAAEADLILGVGKLQGNEEGGVEDPTRWITVSKNKINGWHDTVICQLHHEVSRYVE